MPLNPSREALAVLRGWLADLEERVAVEATAQGQQSVQEREDRELAAAWEARRRARLRGPRRSPAKRNVRQQCHSTARRD